MKFLGRVPLDYLNDLYNAADVLIQPSVNQPQSLPVKEAMAIEKPVIRAYEWETEFAQGECGYMFDPNIE